jgi:hypothetical protein
MSQNKQELQEYFNELTKNHGFVQMRTKALIEKAQNDVTQDRLIRNLIAADDRNVQITTKMDLGDGLLLVIKEAKFQTQICYSFDFLNLKTEEPKRKNDEYYASVEEAVLAAMITRMGGSDSVIHATNLMIMGNKKQNFNNKDEQEMQEVWEELRKKKQNKG